MPRSYYDQPVQIDYCDGCDANLTRQRCICDDEELCVCCRSYHCPSEDCPDEFSAKELSDAA